MKTTFPKNMLFHKTNQQSMGLKSFKYWKRQEVQDTFGLKRVFDMPLMREWLEVDVQTISANERTQIDEL